MILSAAYLTDTSYPFEGITKEAINFGGKFIYDFELNGKTLEISRKLNDQYIDNFFDSSQVVKNVSAIVGSNGAGKTTLIKNLTNLINSSKGSSGILIYEIGDDVAIEQRFTYLELIPKDFKIITLKDRPETVYYSPFLDHKEDIPGINISYDKVLANDLGNLNSRKEENSDVIPIKTLRKANDKRFMDFFNSKYSKSIKKFLKIPYDDQYRVTFNRFKIDVDEESIYLENTPSYFQTYLKKLYLNIKSEYDGINREVENGKERFDLHRGLMKNLVLMDLFCLLIKLMEKHSTYLKKGFFYDVDKAREIIESPNHDAKYKFLYWLENNYYKGRNINGKQSLLPHKEVKEILDFLYEYIDSISFPKELTIPHSRFNYSKKSLYFKLKDLNNLLELNNKLLNALSSYYLTGVKNQPNNEPLYLPVDELLNFVNLEYADRKLSSGETSLVNLFSRLYDAFIKKRNYLNDKPIADNYIIMLDEADLGFHPVWKRKFTKNIIEFTSSFFKSLGSKVQILMTTHDSLTLSDIPNNNVVYLYMDRDKTSKVLGNESSIRPKVTFAANVNDLLGHSFFLEDLLVGDFANSKIQQAIDWIKSNRDKKGDYNHHEFNDIKKIISLIEEPVLRNKLAEMLSDVEVDNDFIQKIIQKQNDYLESILKRQNK